MAQIAIILLLLVTIANDQLLNFTDGEISSCNKYCICIYMYYPLHS